MTTAVVEQEQRTRRSAGLVGNGLVLTGVLLFLAEFVGIVASGVHTMPLLPGASRHDLATTYAGQASTTGFLVGWYSLVLPGRVLIVLGVRQALLASCPDRWSSSWRTLLSWAVALMALGVVVELVSVAVAAGTAAAAVHGPSELVLALDRVAHYLQQPAIAAPSGVATAVLGLAMWRSGVFPRVLAGWFLSSSVVSVLSGALLSAPSTAGLQEGLTVLSLPGIVFSLWLGVLVFVRRPRGEAVRG